VGRVTVKLNNSDAKALKFGRPLPLTILGLYQRPYRQQLLCNAIYRTNGSSSQALVTYERFRDAKAYRCVML